MNEQPTPINIFEKVYPIVSEPNPSGGLDYVVYIFEEILETFHFAEMIETIDSATEIDTIRLKINSPGGYIHSALTLVDSIKSCKTPVTAECSGTVASAATIIALACSGMYIADYTTFMCHNYTGGYYGKGHEVVADIKHTDKNLTNMATNMYQHFLTKKELKAMLRGDDLYFTAEETREKWLNVVEKRTAAYQAEQELEQQEKLQTAIGGLEELGYKITK